ncbi:MAG: DUF1223 domain-containing protein [Isosphaeraceae bacterium]|nr:DUF1223 domain-containing protein [Isosphaeraceae bacterium]
MFRSISALCLALSCTHALAADEPVKAPRNAPRRVLVELYTSQGCNMCPEAERNLGRLGDTVAGVSTVAFHVDYFDKPWKDPFSNKSHSERQLAYNAIYTKPKNAEYGIYYTPMIMVDGIQSVNGRDPEGLSRTVKAAKARKPEVAIGARLDLAGDKRSGKLQLALESRSPRVDGREILVCAVVRDDKVVTPVKSGENANVEFMNRFPARSHAFEFVTLAEGKSTALSLPLELSRDAKTDRLSVIVFAQDRKTGVIHQSALIPWDPSATKGEPKSPGDAEPTSPGAEPSEKAAAAGR